MFIVFTSSMHPLMYIWGEIWGCRLGMGDVKDYSGGVVKSHNFHFVYFINILQDICFNLLCRWESSIPHIISQTTGENPMFLWFFRKKIDFLLIFMYILNTFKSARESWLKGTSHDSIFQFSLFSTLADIFAVLRPLLCTKLIHQSSPAEMT